METADLTHHISRRFNEDLEKVRNQVLQMGGFVEQQLHKAIWLYLRSNWPIQYSLFSQLLLNIQSLTMEALPQPVPG